MWNIINTHCWCSFNASPGYRGAAHESNAIINVSFRVLEVFSSRNRLTLEASIRWITRLFSSTVNFQSGFRSI